MDGSALLRAVTVALLTLALLPLQLARAQIGTFGDVGPNDFAAAFIEQLATDGFTSGSAGRPQCRSQRHG